ncbi:MAG: hypothetical protein K2P58_13800 [Hyphomonadaceae bacterium]|nr:hypothetical protein [Hyphomonadaceae bacterium]
MKKAVSFLGTAAVALMAAGAAHAQGGGYLGVSYYDGTGSVADGVMVDGSAVLGSNVQIDASYSSSDDIDFTSVGGHFFSRTENGVWGGYVGYDVASGSGDDIDEFTVALQVQHYVGRTTLSADLSYSSISDIPFFGEISTTGVSGEARFFQTDNVSAHINLGYAEFDTDFGGGDIKSLGAGLEWKPDSLPISFFGEARGWTSDTVTEESSWRVGARYTWGGSLFDRNRSGAALSQPTGFLDFVF